MMDQVRADGAARAAARPPVDPIASQRAAEAAVQAKQLRIQQEIVPWLAEPIPRVDEQPANLETVEASTRTKLLTLAAEFKSKHEETLRTAAKTGTPTDGTNPLKAAICWTDPAGPAQTNAAIDPVTPRLVNDLDLRIVSPSGGTNFPWLLNPDLTNQTSAARLALATTGDDTRNNVEQVVLTNAVASNYLVRVTHKGSLGTNGQWVSLFLSGVQAKAKPALSISSVAQTATNKLALAWPSVPGQLYQIRYLNSLEGVTNSQSANWSNWDGEISAAKTNTAVEVDMSGPQGRHFYRVFEVE